MASAAESTNTSPPPSTRDVDTAVSEKSSDAVPESCQQEPSDEQNGGESDDTSISSALDKKIVRQMEFYFGDRNLQRDKFLQDKIKEDDGWVLLDVLLTFNRLKSLSTDTAVIVSALRKSTGGVVEVNDDGSKVRRCPALPTPSISLLSQDQRKQLRDRTTYLKGFPEDSTLDEIQELLDQYGETALVSMRKMRPPDEKKFKGSVFAEYKSKESVDKLLAQKEVRFRDSHVLSIETKEGWMTRKTEEKKQSKHKRLNSVNEEEGGNQQAQAKAAAVSKVKKEACVLHFAGVGPDTTREYLKEHFRQYASVAWVDFQIGDKEGYIRFEEEGGARKALDDSTAAVQLNGADTKLTILEGEEQEHYWEKMVDDMYKRKNRKPSGGGWRGGGWRGRGGGRRGGKRSRHDGGEEPAAKRSAES